MPHRPIIYTPIKNPVYLEKINASEELSFQWEDFDGVGQNMREAFFSDDSNHSWNNNHIINDLIEKEASELNESLDFLQDYKEQYPKLCFDESNCSCEPSTLQDCSCLKSKALSDQEIRYSEAYHDHCNESASFCIEDIKDPYSKKTIEDNQNFALKFNMNPEPKGIAIQEDSDLLQKLISVSGQDDLLWRFNSCGGPVYTQEKGYGDYVPCESCHDEHDPSDPDSYYELFTTYNDHDLEVSDIFWSLNFKWYLKTSNDIRCYYEVVSSHYQDSIDSDIGSIAASFPEKMFNPLDQSTSIHESTAFKEAFCFMATMHEKTAPASTKTILETIFQHSTKKDSIKIPIKTINHLKSQYIKCIEAMQSNTWLKSRTWPDDCLINKSITNPCLNSQILDIMIDTKCIDTILEKEWACSASFQDFLRIEELIITSKMLDNPLSRIRKFAKQALENNESKSWDISKITKVIFNKYYRSVNIAAILKNIDHYRGFDFQYLELKICERPDYKDVIGLYTILPERIKSKLNRDNIAQAFAKKLHCSLDNMTQNSIQIELTHATQVFEESSKEFKREILSNPSINPDNMYLNYLRYAKDTQCIAMIRYFFKYEDESKMIKGLLELASINHPEIDYHSIADLIIQKGNASDMISFAEERPEYLNPIIKSMIKTTGFNYGPSKYKLQITRIVKDNNIKNPYVLAIAKCLNPQEPAKHETKLTEKICIISKLRDTTDSVKLYNAFTNKIESIEA